MNSYKNEGYKLVQAMAVTKGFDETRTAAAVSLYAAGVKAHGGQVSAVLAQLLAYSAIENA